MTSYFHGARSGSTPSLVVLPRVAEPPTSYFHGASSGSTPSLVVLHGVTGRPSSSSCTKSQDPRGPGPPRRRRSLHRDLPRLPFGPLQSNVRVSLSISAPQVHTGRACPRRTSWRRGGVYRCMSRQRGHQRVPV